MCRDFKTYVCRNILQKLWDNKLFVKVGKCVFDLTQLDQILHNAQSITLSKLDGHKICGTVRVWACLKWMILPAKAINAAWAQMPTIVLISLSIYFDAISSHSIVYVNIIYISKPIRLAIGQFVTAEMSHQFQKSCDTF